ncbi:MAG: hypothetical protein U1E62_15025 [Alsobacter sp.]
MTLVVQTKFLIALCSFTLTWLLTARAAGAHASGLAIGDETFSLITIAGLLGAIVGTCASGL